jgi:transposase
MKYVGLDIHKNFTYGVIEDDQGTIISEDKIDNSKEQFRLFLENCNPQETKVVMESTCVWEHIYEKLVELKYEVILANPVRTKAIAFAQVKTDSVDAKTLADLHRAKLIAESYIPPKDIRVLREIVRQRNSLIRGKTQLSNKIHAVLLRHGIKSPFKKMGKKMITWIDEEVDESIKLKIQSCINIREKYDEEVSSIDKRIEGLAKRDKIALILMTAPGIGPIWAMGIIAEIGEIDRFQSNEKLFAYSGLVPSVKQSGSNLRFGGLMKQSSKNLKNIFVQASWSATKTKSSNVFKEFYKKLADKKGKQKAICATARKMSGVIRAMWRKQEEFNH